MTHNELYFCLVLTESEHSLVEEDLKDYCSENDLTLLYYRQLKDGHIPTYREVKIVSNDKAGLGRGLARFRAFLGELLLNPVKNPHRS